MIHELGARYYYLPWVFIRKTRDDVKFWNCDIYKPFGANDPPRLPRASPPIARDVSCSSPSVPSPSTLASSSSAKTPSLSFFFHALSLGSAGRTASA